MWTQGLHRAGQWLRALRPRWAWIVLALGLPWLLTPLSCKASPVGCAAILSAWCFWVAVLVLGFLGLRQLWRRLLFRVSRRLWVILLLLSFLPALSLSLFFLSLGWLSLGAQVTRSIQGTVRSHEQALLAAAQEPSDARAVQILRAFGAAHADRIPQLPLGLEPGKPMMVLQHGAPDGTGRGFFLQVATAAPGGFRLLSLDLHRLGAQGHSLWGGKAEYRIYPSREREEDDRPGLKAKARPSGKGSNPLRLDDSDLQSGVEPLDAREVGEVAAGGGIFRPFGLPPVALRALDGATGKPLLLKIRPITSLKEIFLGYGFGHGNLSARTLLVMIILAMALLLLAAFQLVALIMGLHLARQLGKGVDGLFRGVHRLTQGDLAVRIRPRGHDQVAQLTGAFNEMAEQLQAADAVRAERARLEEELRVAREVQMRLLPDVAALAPAIRATILPAREVAGDFFDLFKLADGRYAFFVADVSGKGTSAAFYAAETKGVLAALDKQALGPKEVLDRLNAIWCTGGRGPRVFLTAIYGTYDPSTGAYAFVRAGHPPAFLRRADGSVARLSPGGLGIGLSADRFLPLLEVAEGRLEPGDALLLYTDGLTEAPDEAGNLFGEARLAEALSGVGDPRSLVLRAVDAFLQGRPPEDDLTLLVLQR